MRYVIQQTGSGRWAVIDRQTEIVKCVEYMRGTAARKASNLNHGTEK